MYVSAIRASSLVTQDIRQNMWMSQDKFLMNNAKNDLDCLFFIGTRQQVSVVSVSVSWTLYRCPTISRSNLQMGDYNAKASSVVF